MYTMTYDRLETVQLFPVLNACCLDIYQAIKDLSARRNDHNIRYSRRTW